MLPKVKQKGQEIPFPQLKITIIYYALNSFLNPQNIMYYSIR